MNERTTGYNSTYPQAGASCFVEQEIEYLKSSTSKAVL